MKNSRGCRCSAEERTRPKRGGVGKGRVVGKAQVGVKKSYLEGAAELEAAAGGPKVRLEPETNEVLVSGRESRCTLGLH